MAKEKSTFNLKDQLAGIAALIAAIVAIGGGFVKYGEIQTKLTALTEATGPDLTPLAQQIGNNQKMISDNISGISNNAKANAVLEKEIEGSGIILNTSFLPHHNYLKDSESKISDPHNLAIAISTIDCRSEQQEKNIARIKDSFDPLPIKFSDYFKS